MSWKLPWSSPDAIDHRSKALEEEELHLTRQMEELQQQIASLKNPVPPTPTQPVWRAPKSSETDPSASLIHAPLKTPRRPNRAKQKQDRNLFIVLALLLAFIFFLVIHALR